MNFDELMAVWKSQDASPLHDVNQPLLQEALQQEAAKVQKQRRRERRIHYASSAFVVVLLVLLLTLMIHLRRGSVVTGWDYVMGFGGMIAALVAAGSVYVGHQAQVRREQHFGDSLRDQLNLRIAQFDGVATGAVRRSINLVLMGAICPLAILHLGMRINHKSLIDVKWVPVVLLVLYFWSGARSLRRKLQQANSRKRELESLLKDLDGQ